MTKKDSEKSQGDIVLENIAKKVLLPIAASELNWSGSDDKLSFLKNKKLYGKVWHYRDKEIEYKTNSSNYRTIEFDSVDWANSIVIFGCSNVFGVGVAEDETVSHYLSEIMGRPVINLGAGATSITFSFHNSVMLSQGFPTPWAVIHIWSEISRSILYTKTGLLHFGAWNIGIHPYAKQWNIEHHNPSTQAIFISLASNSMWKNKTKFVEASYFKETAKVLDCIYLELIDNARDIMHPGLNTNQLTANILSTQLFNQ